MMKWNWLNPSHHPSGCISHINFIIKIIGQWKPNQCSHSTRRVRWDDCGWLAGWSYLLLSTNNWLLQSLIIDHWSVLSLPDLTQLCNRFSSTQLHDPDDLGGLEGQKYLHYNVLICSTHLSTWMMKTRRESNTHLHCDRTHQLCK